MAKRITPLDVQAFASREIYDIGEKIFDQNQVKYRFQTDYGLHATVRDKRNHRVEMIVSGEQIFGRCDCQAGSSACEHQVAVLLSWIHEPSTYTSYQTLRKAIRKKDKTTLVDTLMNLTEVFPEISQFFTQLPGLDEEKVIRKEVSSVFDYPKGQKIHPTDLIKPCRILLVHARMLKNENKWNPARILLFEMLNRTLLLIDRRRLIDSFPENFVSEISDEYEEIAYNEPDFDEKRATIIKEINELLDHDCADVEGVYLEQLREKLEIEESV